MNKRRRVLVTGSRGRFARTLLRVLDDQFEMLGVDHHDLDVTEPGKVRDCLRIVRPEIVLHTAAMTHVDGCERNPVEAFRVNETGTKCVAQACREISAKLVCYSTDYVFDGRRERPYTEDDVPNPLNVYGRSKLAGEQIALAICPNATVLRVAWLYGIDGSNFVRTVVDAARAQAAARASHTETEPLLVVSDQCGTPTWTADLARQTAVVIEQQLTGVLHAVSHGSASWQEWAAEIATRLDMSLAMRPCQAEQFWKVARRPTRTVLANKRLADAGADLMRPWQEALAEFLNVHRQELTT